MSPTDHLGLDLSAVPHARDQGRRLDAGAVTAGWRGRMAIGQLATRYSRSRKCLNFCNSSFSGLTVGAVYALVALGFTLIYNASDVINFAQGEFVMLGGMTTVFLGLAGVPLPLAACLADRALTVIVGLAASPFRDRAGTRSQRRRAHHHHHRRLDFPARRRAGRVRQALPQPAVLVRQRSPVGSGAPRSCRRAWSCSPARCMIVLRAVGLHRSHLARQGHRSATAANRLAARLVGHQYPPDRRLVLRHFGGDRGGGRHPHRAHHADEL